MSQKSIGRYEIVDELGRGGMATVYRAYDPTLEREVALKLLPNYFAHDPEFSARFEREAKTVASLEHNAIVSMYDYGEDGEWPYFVMRLMQGGSLKDRIAAGPLDPQEAVDIVNRVAGALDKAHKRGIVHRDLKPGNIMFDEDGEAYLGDFGIVKLAEGSESYTRTGNTLGTPAYMSPEQADGRPDIDGRSDVYALGIILYEMLTGSAPYVHDSMPRLLVMHLTEPIPNIVEARSDLPAAMQAVIEKAMAKEPENRFATAGELASAAQSAMDEGASSAQHEATATSETEPMVETAEPAPATSQVPTTEPHTTAAMIETGTEVAKPEPAEATGVPESEAIPAATVSASPIAATGTPEKPGAAKRGIPKWSIGVVAVVVIGIIAAVAVSGGGGDSEPADEPGASGPVNTTQDSGFEITNLNDFPICGLFVGPTAAEDWDLDGISMGPGEVIDYSGEPDLYNFLAFDCDDELIFEAYEVEMVAGSTTEMLIEANVSTSSSEPVDALEEGAFFFVNLTGSQVCALYISPTDSEDWGDDYLGGVPMEPDDSVDFVGQPGSYDYYAESCDGEVVAEEYGAIMEPGFGIEIQLP